MNQPWKGIVRRGDFKHPRWRGQADRYRGKTWNVVVFPVELERATELSVHSFGCGSSDPFPTVEDAVRGAQELVPTGVDWEAS